ncbi:MAG TPA: prephenate dehydrogenase/arogenate dehydrogenase family protein [Candidatus Nanoarchaeia archaeon]|nr:prephenate dehydrogenase/arogenate dehydrogenase family protein [Candidatus Nanoarchaeia archaeon]
MEAKTIGIIGGTGQMGQWLKRFFEKNDCKVLIAGRKTKLTPEELTQRSDVIILAVPISAVTAAVKQICAHIRPDSLLMDIASLKKDPVKAMLENVSCAVIGTHPVFGPSVQSIKNQTVVICPARPKQWLSWLTDLFENNGALVRITTPEKHDKMMSIIQGVNHFSTICMAHTLKKLGIDVEESLHYTSPIYKVRMDMVGRLLAQDPYLYADIEMLNPENKKAMEEYISSARELLGIIKRKDRDEFVKYFEEGSDFLGNFKKEAVEYSDYIIEQLVKKGSLKDPK